MEEQIKCFAEGNLSVGALVGITYAIAVLLYFIVIFIAERSCTKMPRAKRAVKKIRLWLFLLCLELASMVNLLLLDVPDHTLDDLQRVFVALVILTMMMCVISITRSIYFRQKEQLSKKVKTDPSAKASLTQMLFLYRFVVLGIIVIAFGVILLVFPYIRSVGIGILGSAGIAGLAVGIAAKPILLNMMVGFQIALNKMVKIGDFVKIGDHIGLIENIHLTRVILMTWDNRRVLIPISHLLDNEFESYDLREGSIIGSVFIYCDYSAPTDVIRQKFEQLLQEHPFYDGNFSSVVVSDLTKDAMEIRLAMSSTHFSDLFLLRAFIREHMIQFLQKQYPTALPSLRYKNFATPAEKL